MKPIRTLLFSGLTFSVIVMALSVVASCSRHHRQYVVVIGDQQAAASGSWVTMLKEKMPDDRILNFSRTGNTYGFNNFGNDKLNTLRNLEIYLDDALDSTGGRIDYLVIALGRNDCKRTFDDELALVPDYLREMIRTVHGFPGFKSRPPRIIILSPPPFRPDSALPSRYQGADERVRYLLPYFKDITHQNRCTFIDIFTQMEQDPVEYTNNDGLSFNEKGHALIARSVYRAIYPEP